MTRTTSEAEVNRPSTKAGGSRRSRERLLATLFSPGMQDYVMPLLDQELSGHATQAIGRASNENTRHAFVLFSLNRL